VRFVQLLERLPIESVERLLASRGARLDPKKILPPSEQAARALAPLTPRLLASLPGSARSTLERLAPPPGAIDRADLTKGARALVDLGLAFEVEDALVCPTAVRVQLPLTARDDPRGARALLLSAGEETVRTLVQGALRGQPTNVRSLLLGEMLARLEDEGSLAQEIAALPRDERLALSAIEARGGEVGGSELLALAREPARWETPGAIPKRGPAHALLARGYLFPAGHDRFVLASEVAAIAGRERREVLERRRRALLEKIEAAEDEPARADLAHDPGPLALALLVELGDGLDRASAGKSVRRTDLARAARTLDVSPDRAELLVVLVRALPLEALTIAEIGPQLLASWRRSAQGDESRLATARTAEGPSAITLVRELVVDALASLPRARFVSLDDVIHAVRADLRAEGVETGMRARGAQPLDDVIARIAQTSLPALGLVDVARDGALRLASRASALLGGEAVRPTTTEHATHWTDRRVRFEPSSRASIALGLANVARAAIDDGLVLALDPSRARPLAIDRAQLTRALERADAPADVLRWMIDSLPSALAIVHATPPARWIAIEDASLRARLLEDPAILREVVEGGPAGGLLLHAHGSFPRIVRLFAKHGVDLRDRP
jgi:hypothetical protein